VVDFLCVATGGPCKYTGRDMKTVHTGLKITESDWNSMVKHLVGTLDKFKVPEKEKSDVLTALSGLKGDIVGRGDGRPTWVEMGPPAHSRQGWYKCFALIELYPVPIC